MECYIANYSALNIYFRLDSEYRLHKYVANEKYLKGQPLHKYCAKELITNIRALPNIDNFKYIEISNVNNNPIDYTSKTVSFDKIPSRAVYVLKPKDIAVSTVRPNRNSVAFINDCRLQVGTNGFCILRINENKILPEYVLAYCKTKFFITKLERESTATMYPYVTDEIINNIKLEIPPVEIQANVVAGVDKAIILLEQSKCLYKEAEQLLKDELGINQEPFERKNKIENSVRNFSSVFKNSARIDAEYYHSKYDLLEKTVRKNCTDVKLIKDIAVFNARGVQPEYVQDGELQVINSRHILEYRLDYGNFESTDMQAWEIEKSRVYYGDILIYTTGANVGRTAPYLINSKSVASNHVNILRLRNINFIYAAFVLNSLIGKLQTEQMCTGSAQAELYPKDIDKFYIPILSSEVQTQIAEKIHRSFELQKQSRQILENAKHIVENDIEKKR